MKQKEKDKKAGNAIVDAARYECAAMCARLAMSWLDRVGVHLARIRPARRSPEHEKMEELSNRLSCLLVDFACTLHRNGEEVEVER